MNSTVRYKKHCVHVNGNMTIYTCEELKSRLFDQLTAHPQTAGLDLSRVAEIDTAGLQLLLLARRQASAAGRELQVLNPSSAVSEVLELCQLSSWLAPAATGAP